MGNQERRGPRNYIIYFHNSDMIMPLTCRDQRGSHERPAAFAAVLIAVLLMAVFGMVVLANYIT